MVFGRDQERCICFKAIPLRLRCLQDKEVFVLEIFSVHATPTTPPLTARKSPSIHVCSPAHARSPWFATRLHNVLFSSLLGGGRQDKGERPLEKPRNVGTFLHRRCSLPLAPSHPSLARNRDTFPVTRDVPSALPRLVLPSTTVLSLGIPPFI